MSDFKAEGAQNPFDVWLDTKVTRPGLEYVPRSVTPNTISLMNAVVCWMMFFLAALAPSLGPLQRLIALTITGALMFSSMVLDCWDGMQARRTGKTSKIGELLDHWLDAIHVPLVTAAMALVLELPPWVAVVVHVSNGMIYNAQLVKYHRSGRFVHAPTSGVQAQFGVSLGFVAAGVLFFFFPRETPWVGYLVTGIALASTFMQLKQCWFYYDMLPGQLGGHYPFVLHGLVFGGLYLVGAMDMLAFVLLVVLVSFRLSGSYVLFTIVKKPFSGNDWGIAVFAVAIAAAHFSGAGPIVTREMAEAGYAGYPLPLVLSYLACAYLLLRNGADFMRHLPALRPSPQTAAAR